MKTFVIGASVTCVVLSTINVAIIIGEGLTPERILHAILPALTAVFVSATATMVGRAGKQN